MRGFYCCEVRGFWKGCLLGRPGRIPIGGVVRQLGFLHIGHTTGSGTLGTHRLPHRKQVNLGIVFLSGFIVVRKTTTHAVMNASPKNTDV